jgi:hypothetical protein
MVSIVSLVCSFWTKEFMFLIVLVVKIVVKTKPWNTLKEDLQGDSSFHLVAVDKFTLDKHRFISKVFMS